MATVQYSPNSPYYQTTFNGNSLDVATLPQITPKPDDVIFVINDIYRYRPDLLAYDLYGSAEYWWVFALRNPNVIQDPIFSMKIGTRIYLPSKDVVSNLGR